MQCTTTCRILDTAELYDPRKGKWTATGHLAAARRDQTATLLGDGRVLVAGGYGGGCPPCTSLSSAELYDPHTWRWSKTGHMATARFSDLATLMPSGKVLVVGGRNCVMSSCTSLSSAEVYNPRSGTWAATGSIHTQVCGDTATLLGTGQVLVTCANGSAELYDPHTGQWATTGTMNATRTGSAVTLLRTGQVLVAGGCCGKAGILASVELYDPHTGQWTMTGSMVTPRTNPTATLLRDGRVLIAGGCCGKTGVLATTELYDPQTGHWTAGDSMSTARRNHTSTLLANGQVLLTGGYSGGCPPCTSLSSAELYHPPAAR
jgi:N-acetylneuraminic acid mutarotase